jgi:hypothetical protein
LGTSPTRGEVIMHVLQHKMFFLSEKQGCTYLSPCGRGRREASGEGYFK